MKSFQRHTLTGYLWSVIGPGVVVLGFKIIVAGLNPTTVALSFLLVVLVTASRYGLAPGITASILGMLCFNFFFLPPFGTLTVYDPQNWLALFAFLATAVITSQLSSAARSRARDAERRREEVLKLYELSRAIIATPYSETVLSSIARQVVETVESGHCEIFLPGGKGSWSQMAAADLRGSRTTSVSSADTVEKVFRTGEVEIIVDGPGEVIAYAPLKVGIRPIGVMVMDAETVERGTIEAIAGLVAIALERARFLAEVSRAEMLRQSDQLKSAILASVSHDLRTPLTSIRAAIDNLMQGDLTWDKSALREFHLIISEEVDRLTRLVENLLDMARIEAGELHPVKVWCSVAEILSNVLERCSPITHHHVIKHTRAGNFPLVKLDPRLVAEALTNLVENAVKYSPSGSEILLDARIADNELIISVTDEGTGIAADELDMVFNKFYRATRTSGRQGTGMGLAIARGIVESHSGRIWVESRLGQGATFRLAVPVEQKRPAEQLAINQ